jgi:hypothetical protein
MNGLRYKRLSVESDIRWFTFSFCVKDDVNFPQFFLTSVKEIGSCPKR